jgi:hypothetical protein
VEDTSAVLGLERHHLPRSCSSPATPCWESANLPRPPPQPQKFSGFEVGAQRHTTRGSRPHSEAPLSWTRSRSPRNCLSSSAGFDVGLGRPGRPCATWAQPPRNRLSLAAGFDARFGRPVDHASRQPRSRSEVRSPCRWVSQTWAQDPLQGDLEELEILAVLAAPEGRKSSRRQGSAPGSSYAEGPGLLTSTRARPQRRRRSSG